MKSKKATATNTTAITGVNDATTAPVITNLVLEAQLAEQKKMFQQLESYVAEINARTTSSGKPKKVLGFLFSNRVEIMAIVKLIIKLVIKNSNNPKIKNLDPDTVFN